MKFLSLLLAVSLSQTEVSHYEELLAKAQFTELEQQIIRQPDYQQQSAVLIIYAKALISQQRLDDANTLLDFAVTAFPDNSELNYLAGLSKIRLARDGNVFAAKDRAARGVAMLQKAIALNPDNFLARQALIDFYSIAPAAAGGDKTQARQMAEKLAEDDPVQAALAQSRILLNEKKTDEALAVLDLYITEPPHPKLLARKAQILNDLSVFPAAFTNYQLLAEYATDLADKYGALYNIGRLAVIADQDIFAGISALQKYLEFYEHSENQHLNWATLRLAQLMYRAGDAEEAILLINKLSSVRVNDEEFNLILLSLSSALAQKSKSDAIAEPEQL
ncbi:hypothetical protein QE250_11475 [Chromatiaceae bacterium AAb-1]|nr:hypothetical protein [Chromatiaceae bacterium AAb-1]